MILVECGKIAKQCWLEIPEHFKEVRLDEHVIMPNHVHGIVIIDSDEDVGNRHACSLQGRQYKKLPVVIGSYKSAVSGEINKSQINFISNGRNHSTITSFETINLWTKSKNIFVTTP